MTSREVLDAVLAAVGVDDMPGWYMTDEERAEAERIILEYGMFQFDEGLCK
jgi:hypothetical protein